MRVLKRQVGDVFDGAGYSDAFCVLAAHECAAVDAGHRFRNYKINFTRTRVALDGIGGKIRAVPLESVAKAV